MNKKELGTYSGSSAPVERGFDSLQRRMNRLFDDFFTGFEVAPFSGWTGKLANFNPRMNISEDEKQFKVTAELPGMEQNQVDISLTRDALTIRGEKRDEHEEKEGDSWYLKERVSGSFMRTFPLNCEVDQDKVDATFNKGVLTIVLPKSQTAQQKTRKISVRAS